MNQTEVVDRLNMKEKTIPKINPGFAALCILIAAVLLLAGVGIGYGLHPEQKIPHLAELN